MKSDDEKSAESTHQNWHAAFHLSFPRGFTKLGFPEKVENTRHFSTTFSFRLSVAAATATSLTTGEKVLKTHILTFVENGMAEKKKVSLEWYERDTTACKFVELNKKSPGTWWFSKSQRKVIENLLHRVWVVWVKVCGTFTKGWKVAEKRDFLHKLFFSFTHLGFLLQN